ncbi:hypothetical protein [uncultured Nitratireductor sp.]|uniref:hypothetical protein n=1 Tax=uncultured Nitratireductor sp. TaxID=520953 RepID=UPI0025E14BE8|nr:hypothetical protein [uncultured Nitratireductor sp.]
MTGPVNINPRSQVRGLDDVLTAGGEGWEALEKLMQPAVMPDQSRPDNRVLRFAGAISRTEDGRLFLDWLFLLTLDSPYPRVGGDFQEAALAAAKHEARANIGELLRKAVVEGRELLNQNGAEK